MTNPARAFDPRQFLPHLYKYGFLYRSGGRGPRYGPPFIRVCDNIVAECLRFADVTTNSTANQRLILPNICVTHPSASNSMDSPPPHLVNARTFLDSEASPLKKKKSETFSIIQGLRNESPSDDAAFTNLDSFPHLSVIRYFPPDCTLSRIATHRRKRLRFYRRYAELPGGFSVSDDGSLFYSHSEDSSYSEEGDEREDCLKVTNNRGFLLERVQPFSLSPSTPIGDDDALQWVEFHVDVERAAMAYLLDAFRIWQRYRNFSLHFRLAPTKAIIAAKRSDQEHKTVAAVINWIREDLVEKNGLPCELFTVDDEIFDDEDNLPTFYDSNDDDDDVYEKPTLSSLLQDNGLGVPFYIAIDKSVAKKGIVKLFQRETRLAEEIHIQFLTKKLTAYLSAS